jgi:serine/threonine protein phosphatase 1
VGDIHGCAHLLDRLAELIKIDLAERPVENAQAVFLGDYIDRGPHSAAVLSRLGQGDFPIPFLSLRGNHEQMLTAFLNDALYFDVWRRFGGLETLHSFGIPITNLREPDDFRRAQENLKETLSSEIVRFLEGTLVCHALDDYFFCHAGVRPGIPLASQRDEDLLWIRNDFLASRLEHGKLIVHGHTPVDAPEERENRINIDTGAYLSGTLTCLVLEGTSRRFLLTAT